MKRRRTSDEEVEENPAAEHDDPGILADDSSGDDDVSDDNSSSEGGSDDGDGFHDSELDEGFDPDAEADGRSSDGEEAAASSDDEQQPAASGSDLDAELDAEEQPRSSKRALPQRSGKAAGSESELEEDEDIADDEDDDNEADPTAGPSSNQQQHASFLEGGKSASFAKAFAKIMGKGSKAASTAAAGDVILSESASLAKRKAEVAADEAAAREARKQRLELKKRGHYKVPKKGADPAHDAREKQLQKLATRGVVLLFNAVNKAQKQKREAEAAGIKGAKALKAKPGVHSKAGFFAELKAGARQAVAGLEGEQLVPEITAAGRKGQQISRSLQPQDKQGPARGSEGAAGGSGWDVLGEGFPGLTGGVKMKDWDKSAVEDEELNGQVLAGSDDDDDDGDEGW